MIMLTFLSNRWWIGVPDVKLRNKEGTQGRGRYEGEASRATGRGWDWTSSVGGGAGAHGATDDLSTEVEIFNL